MMTFVLRPLRILQAGCLLGLFGLSGTSLAQDQPVPPWMAPEVLKAAIDINMTQEQSQQFRGAITEFLQGFNADVRKLLNGNNVTNMPRKIAKKRRVRVESMDEQMGAILSAEQQAAYANYRDLLLAKMDEAAAARRR
ncbi:MAG: hypothetical protein AAF513_04545 [Pseudomonadota bacterium]